MKKITPVETLESNSVSPEELNRVLLAMGFTKGTGEFLSLLGTMAHQGLNALTCTDQEWDGFNVTVSVEGLEKQKNGEGGTPPSRRASPSPSVIPGGKGFDC